jgi:hypothetical protein
MEYIVTFPNTNSAIKSEQLLIARSLHVSVMPLPGQIRAGCGICLRLRPDETGRALELLAESGIGETGVYMRTEQDGAYTYSQAKDGDIPWNRN